MEQAQGGRERLPDLLRVVHDESLTQCLLHLLQESPSPQEGREEEKTAVREVVEKCGGLQAFALLFDQWVRAQAQPFLSCKPVEKNLSSTFTDSSSTASLGSAKVKAKAPQTGGQKKTKKKITPQTISSLLPPTLTDGNISRQKNDSGEDSATLHDNFPRLGEKNKSNVLTSSSQWPTLGSAKPSKVDVSRSVEPSRRESGSLGSHTKKNFKKRAVLLTCDNSTTSLKGNITENTTHTVNEEKTKIETSENNFGVIEKELGAEEDQLFDNLPPPTLCHQISHTVKSQLDSLGVTVTVEDQAKKDSPKNTSESVSLESKLSEGPVNLDNTFSSVKDTSQSTVTPQCAEIAAKNMGKIYGHIVLRFNMEYFSLSPCIIFMTKILSVRYIHSEKIISLSLKDMTKFPSCLLNNNLLEVFILNVIGAALPLLHAVGGFLFDALAGILEPVAPDIFLKIKEDAKKFQMHKMIVTQQQSEEDKLLNSSNVDGFIRPFDDDHDNRNDYKSHIEQNIYNERERCFDDFSNLFRQYQDVSRSDLDGSKTSDFWASLHTRGSKILNLQDSNFLWFAKMFKDMLLFHGTNMPKINSSNSVGGSTVQSKNSVSLRQQSTVRASSEDMTATSLKHRHLEERLGQGGGKSLPNRRPSGFTSNPPTSGSGRNTSSKNSITITSTSQRMKNLSDSHNDPSSHFPGCQHFFYRFLLVMDSHRLNVILQDLLLSESLRLLEITGNAFQSFLSQYKIESLSSNNGIQLQKSQKRFESSLTIRTLKLTILAKFLGMLHFSPSWNLAVSSLDESPLITSAESYANEKLSLNASLPLYKILRHCWTDASLSLAVPWVTNYLRMRSWDSTSIFNMSRRYLLNYVQTKSFSSNFEGVYDLEEECIHCYFCLRSIVNSETFDMSRQTEISKNRVSVVFEIQSFISDFPILKCLNKFSGATFEMWLNCLPSTLQRNKSNRESQSQEYETGTTSCTRVDDYNYGLSQSYLKYILPDLFQAISSMRHRFLQHQRRKELFCEQLLSSSSLISKTTSLRSTATKRQVPTLVSPHLINLNTNPPAESLPHPPLQSPPRRSSNVKNASPSHHFDVMKSPLLLSPRSSSFDGGDFFNFDSQQKRVNSGIRTSNDKNDEYITTFTQSRSALASRSMSFGSSAQEGDTLSTRDDIQMQLEISFWNQHPHLYNICNYVVDHIGQACRQRLKERVADLVLQAWSCCDVASSQCLCDFKGSTPLDGNDIDRLVSKYQAIIEKQTASLFRSMASETEDYLEEFVGDHILKALNPFLSVYSMSDGVKDTVNKIAKRQTDPLKKALLNFYSVYARKKLSEVCTKSVQQQRKFLSETDSQLLSTPSASDIAGNVASRSSDASAVADIVTHLIEDRDVLMQRLRDALFHTLQFPVKNKESMCNIEIRKSKINQNNTDGPVDVTSVNRDMLILYLFTERLSVTFTPQVPLSDRVLKSCKLHSSGFRSFSGHICGMMAKCTSICGHITLAQLAVMYLKESCAHNACEVLIPQRLESDEKFWKGSAALIMIWNNVSMLSVVVKWCARQIELFPKSCQCIGRLKIDIMKMLTVAIDTLFVYDVFLDKQERVENFAPFSHASSVVLELLSLDIISLESVCQLIGYALSHSLTTTVFSLLKKGSTYKSSIMSFVGRMLVEICNQSSMNLDIDVDAGSWATDPSVRRIIKSDISPELARVIEKLAKNH